ncbi:hypothetical protein SISSUDRAFT_490542 [Sistotremastrum suecicum HHB10207 ss-3]|uniref:Uncharacterized protein n=1 Tax=Sistotremastrum suecicum HHB10207 ss-3 TaxID=1314776 RepID=A0A165XZ85_9AGAM|nr:hypothetical protein SISSUDRAFT_490542 [Sistotremastrum suecicum HHB10207 ss-3]
MIPLRSFRSCHSRDGTSLTPTLLVGSDSGVWFEPCLCTFVLCTGVNDSLSLELRYWDQLWYSLYLCIIIVFIRHPPLINFSRPAYVIISNPLGPSVSKRNAWLANDRRSKENQIMESILHERTSVQYQ